MKDWQNALYRLWNAIPGEKVIGRKIAASSGRRLIIADIHGCFQTFNALLSRINLQREDQLFILGDMINRGPYSALVVDRILELLKDGYAIFPLRGNHEHMYLKETGWELEALAKEYHALQLVKRGQLKNRYHLFFNMLPYYYELDCAFLVHAGFAFHKDQPLERKKPMLLIRDFSYSGKAVKNKMVLHGHQPNELHHIQQQINGQKPVIPLDNGCVMGRIDKGYGHLLAFDLDSRQLYVQPNLDMVLNVKKF